MVTPSVIDFDRRERFPPLLLGERNFATIVIGDDDFVGAVMDFYSRTTALNTAEPDTGYVPFGTVWLSYFWPP